MNLTKPPALRQGDAVAIVAPSAPLLDEQAYGRALNRLSQMGYTVVEGRSIRSRRHYMAGDDELRAADLQDMFRDPEVKAIISLIGGASANRLLSRLNYQEIAANPKIFTGLSDITNLHLAFASQARMVSLHSIDATFGFGGDPADPAIAYSIDLFQRVVSSTVPLGPLPAFCEWEAWHSGTATGNLVGGYLPALPLLVGSSYWPAFKEIILFWEAIGCEIHDIDRYLHALRACGVFECVSGMLVGQLIDCEENEFAGSAPTVRALVEEIADEYGFPVLANVDFGHGDSNLPLPVGVRASMDASAGVLSLLESYVR